MTQVQDRVSPSKVICYFTILLYILLFVRSVNSASCYRCQSLELNGECYNRSRYYKLIRDCPFDEVCAKIEGQTKSGQKVLIRDCYKPTYLGRKTENYRHSCLSYYGMSIDGWISLCPNSYCNNAFSSKMMTTKEKTTFLFILMTALFMKDLFIIDL
jgi:hypothetical protein